MRSLTRFLKTTAYIMLAVLAGIQLFIIQASLDINKTQLNPDFHKYLFVKNGVYSHTQTVISSSINDFINNLKKNSSQNVDRHSGAFSLLEKAASQQIVKLNLDNVKDGLFQYFKGEKQFLPDIYLGTGPKANKTAQSLANIDKINLSAILLYINRSDIADYLLFLKLLFYVMSSIPGFSFLILLMLVLAGIVICKKYLDISKWVGIALLTCAILSVLSGVGLFLYSAYTMPKNIGPIAMSIPLQQEVIISYLRDCIRPSSVFLVISGILLSVLSAFLFLLPRFLPNVFYSATPCTGEASCRWKNIVRNAVYVVIFLIAAASICYKAYNIKKDFEANNFNNVISRMFSTNTSTQVISARDDTIYVLQVKLMDAKTNSPISNARVSINGKSDKSKKVFNLSEVTTDSGFAKFSLDSGTFHISFAPGNFPSGYQVPSPFFTNLKTSGTTIITVNVDPNAETEKQKWGIVEVEVMDKDNKPVSGLELAVQGIAVAPGHPDNVLSFTNSEGMAVFKLNEGSYKLGFSEPNFPKQYNLPPSFDAIVIPDEVTRYSIRLVDLKKKK